MTAIEFKLESLSNHLDRIMSVGMTGSVLKTVGLTISVSGLSAPLGALCRIHRHNGKPLDAQVIGFHGEETFLLSLGKLDGIRRGNRVELVQSVPALRVGDKLLGRIVNGRGEFIDQQPSAFLPHIAQVQATPTSPLERPRIDEVLETGVRVIDGFLTCGKGQRLGIFAGSGVGKSTLMGQLARSSSADVNVVVLVGERGREVREFLERDLGPEGLKRSVVVVATSDEPAVLRLQSAFLGTAIAEYFRDQGKDVLLMMDSVTRFALAQREIGLAAGEPPATRGYPPSVFSLMPQLLERSGRTNKGSITGFYTVLVEGDDTNEPISDTVRGILDGHIVLSRKIAHEAHFPAIDVLESISRSMSDITTPDHRQHANNIRRLMAAYQQSEDLINIGAYQQGTNPVVDSAISLRGGLLKFLQQPPGERTSWADTQKQLKQLDTLPASGTTLPGGMRQGAPPKMK
ncbi:putative ATP synthase YscN [Polystyrenella longa]|uniref:Putative ATP synthase YscN n=1 Tax=Polystyrenella longa TaxID=2528007 RepID=A0A518CIQ6_9PLAN|nr:FliI/YscN family ATPase [Polystyrenella longa]QDU79116.1 putative ATP synthase YscN [Polystyrenella longa]